MTDIILNEIKRLSVLDTKTLSQKITKTVTEVGELARVGLGLEEASGSLDTVANREMLLEESCDVMLCAASIPFSMGFSEVEVLEMLSRKISKWSGKAQRESTILSTLPYELHISIDITDIEKARSVCLANGIKLTEIAISRDGVLFDAMTSSVFYGTNQGAFEQLAGTEKMFNEAGVTVVRRKIESSPWHPLVPVNADMPKGCYFEAHIGVALREENEEAYQARWADLRKITGDHGCKASFNLNKIFTATNQMVMVTLRSYVLERTKFQNALNNVMASLVSSGFDATKPNIEFAIYDSNPQHDYLW